MMPKNPSLLFYIANHTEAVDTPLHAFVSARYKSVHKRSAEHCGATSNDICMLHPYICMVRLTEEIIIALQTLTRAFRCHSFIIPLSFVIDRSTNQQPITTKLVWTTSEPRDAQPLDTTSRFANDNAPS